MTKSRNFPIVLKSIIRDTLSDTPTFTLNDKQIRSRLRKKVSSHLHNTSWIANNQSEYDAIRCAYDTVYASKIAKPARVRKPRTAKTTETA